ncbi:TIGR00341 family protein [Haladaptatus halobius]|uniref:TIGR00341 family protein n=1 Tax=Haladaptatus halobius TaxID=2884875 RepID=UPI001D0ABCD4|nr:TIGR00341 family protein [Haladaptatus halobius]
MRSIKIRVPAEKQAAVLEILDDEGIDFDITTEISNRNYAAVVSFPLPTNAVEPVLDRLRENGGLDEDTYMIIVDAETVIAPHFESLKERYAAETPGEGRIAREELYTRANNLVPDFGTYLIMTIISAVVAAIGLLVNSPAIVVGSMVIAPLLGPAMETSVGTVTSDREMFFHGLKLQLIGFAVAIISAILISLLVKTTALLPSGVNVVELSQVKGRLSPDFLSLIVALGAGIAGALSLSTGVSTALVGVMIAAALIPPIALVGIGIAWGLPVVVFGSSILVLVNVLSINLAALLVLWYQGYRPEQWFKRSEAQYETIKHILILFLGIVILSVVLANVTYSTAQSAQFEQKANAEITALLHSPEHKQLTLLNMQVEYGGKFPFQHANRIIVTVGHPPGTSYPNLATQIDRRVSNATGQDIAVQVRFVEIDNTD